MTELQTTEIPFAFEAVDMIGFAHESYAYTKYHAFNGYYGNWVELIPEGNYVGGKCGGKTAIVLRSTIIYAFDPEGTYSLVDEDLPLAPRSIRISQNYPNPFNSSTIINYALTAPAEVVIELYDILGRSVETIDEGEKTAGEHQIIWNADDQPSGIYFYRIQAGDYTETKKMVLLK